VNINNCTYDVGTSIITCTALQAAPAFSLQFTFNDMPNVAEFTSLFDSYMITGVKLQFKLINNPNATWQVNNGTGASNASNGANFYPTIWYSPDHDDSNTVSLAAIKEFEKVRHKVLRPNQELNIMLRPTTLTQIYRSSVTTGYANNMKRQWLDMVNPDIPHYGCKFVVDMEGLSPVQSFLIKVNAKLFFTCKNVR